MLAQKPSQNSLTVISAMPDGGGGQHETVTESIESLIRLVLLVVYIVGTSCFLAGITQKEFASNGTDEIGNGVVMSAFRRCVKDHQTHTITCTRHEKHTARQMEALLAVWASIALLVFFHILVSLMTSNRIKHPKRTMVLDIGLSLSGAVFQWAHFLKTISVLHNIMHCFNVLVSMKCAFCGIILDSLCFVVLCFLGTYKKAVPMYTYLDPVVVDLSPSPEQQGSFQHDNNNYPQYNHSLAMPPREITSQFDTRWQWPQSIGSGRSNQQFSIPPQSFSINDKYSANNRSVFDPDASFSIS